MVRTKEEIIGAIKDRFGEETDDALIGIIEDVSDTLDGLTDVVEETEDVVEEVSAPKTFEDLFTSAMQCLFTDIYPQAVAVAVYHLKKRRRCQYGCG